MKTYLVWKYEDNRSEARKVEAHSAGNAAETFGEHRDRWTAEYSIASGNAQRVWVVLDAPGSKPELYEVTGESMPIYYAERVQS